MTAAPGAYVIAIKLAEPVVVTFAGRPPIPLPAGRYLYCGSARGPGGLEGRISRHMRRGKACSHQALSGAKKSGVIKSEEPFAVVIFCTSDFRKLDAKTRSKWSRALRYAERFKPDNQGLAQFIKSKGGINECAARYSDCLR